MTMRLVFSDLDGSFLDHDSYDWRAAEPAFRALRARQIPCIWNTSKTAVEVIEFRKSLNPEDPFIVENGGAVLIPTQHALWRPGLSARTEFSSELPAGRSAVDNGPCRGALSPSNTGRVAAEAMQSNIGALAAVRFGPGREGIVEVLAGLRNRFRFRGFHEMDAEEVVQHTGLSLAQARLALQREYTEPLLWLGSESSIPAFREALSESGLTAVRGGRFLHVAAPHDKGTALQWLSECWEASSGDAVASLALGDGENDLAMLIAADTGALLSREMPDWPGLAKVSHLLRPPSAGPQGWSEAVAAWLDMELE